MLLSNVGDMMLAAVISRGLDLVVLAIFLVGVVVLGLYCAKRNNTTEEYFLGSRSFPGWAVGLSMVGTSISAVTFLAFPAAAFVLDYRQLVPNLMTPLVILFAVIFVIPIFRSRRDTSAFEYLERRFGPVVRLYGSISFLILQIARLGTILYLVAIPLATLTGVNILTVIFVFGLFVSVYTVFGGIGAVIWTDVIQTFVLGFGALFCIGYMVFAIPGNIATVLEVGMTGSKFSIGPTDFTVSDRTVWVMMLLGLLIFGTEYTSNQNVVQRYLASRSTREARKATIICGLTALPMWFFFFFLGTCLYVYYVQFPDAAVAGMSADEVLPYFILSKIPAGIAGLIIAGAVAAAMSSLDSSLNAVATITTVDILKRYIKPDAPDQYYLAMARWIATCAGMMMVAGAFGFHYMPRESIVDLGLILGAFFGGSLVSLFLMGFLTTRVGYRAAIAGMTVSVVLNVYLVFNSFGWLPASVQVDVHDYAINFFVNLAAVMVAYPVGVILWRLGVDRERDLIGLTVWTMKHAGKSPASKPSSVTLSRGNEERETV